MIQRTDWLWLLGMNATANVAVAAAFGDNGAGEPWFQVLADAWPGFVVSTTISLLCVFAVPPLARLLLLDHAPWRRWPILVATLSALAIVGSALAIGMLTLLGRVDGWTLFAPTLWDTLKIAILVTVAFGAYTVRNEALRSKLAEITLALRTIERDEAEARRAASESQLASLEARVNPHFLFNTLNSIAALTREDAVGAERMTTQLASLMRSSLGVDSRPLVSLEQEAQNVRDYLEIEQVRFGNRLRYNIRIAADAQTALVPRFAVQTLVENSVKYAVSARRDGASVTVSGQRMNGRVHLEVADDGPGFDAASIGDGHGLETLRTRLALLYHGDAELHVESHAGRTAVSIHLPSSTDAT
jgi:signal transduction histidine kinase